MNRRGFLNAILASPLLKWLPRHEPTAQEIFDAAHSRLMELGTPAFKSGEAIEAYFPELDDQWIRDNWHRFKSEPSDFIIPEDYRLTI